MKWIARKRIKAAIKEQYRLRDNFLYARRQDPISMYDYMNKIDDLWAQANWHYRWAQKLEYLLAKYSK